MSRQLQQLLPLCDAKLASDDRFSELYERKSKLDGAFASCYTVVNRETGLKYALRMITRSEVDVDGKFHELADSIAAQRRLRDAPSESDDDYMHASFSKLHEVLGGLRRIFVINELPPPGGYVCTDLLSVVGKTGRLQEGEAKEIFSKLVLATKRVHEHSVAIRNIKPEAVHVRRQTADAPWEVMLTDLHHAAIADDGDTDEGKLTGLHGTPEYAAPELVIWYWHEGGQAPPPPAYGIKADTWSLGMTLHVMLTGAFPFDSTQPEEDMLRVINAANFTFDDPVWSRLSESALDLVKQLLDRDPLNRPVMEEVLQHDFCANTLNAAASLKTSLRQDDYENALAALEDDEDD